VLTWNPPSLGFLERDEPVGGLFVWSQVKGIASSVSAAAPYWLRKFASGELPEPSVMGIIGLPPTLRMQSATMSPNCASGRREALHRCIQADAG
jgi:hypothetical protein